MHTPAPSPPSPQLFFDTINAYQRTAALEAAIRLGVFTAIGEGAATAAALASRLGGSERSLRILCDSLAVLGFLRKEEGRYHLTPDSALFLDRRSPAYLGDALDFLLSPTLRRAHQDLTATVQRGTTILEDGGTVAPEHPVWVQFARVMAPLMAMPSELLAKLAGAARGEPWKVLDVAAGHGLFGIAFATLNPRAVVHALDWPQVVEVAREHAQARGVADRFHAIAGSAFEADLGEGYDVILLPNFLHHFDRAACETLLARLERALAPEGRVFTLEFIPDEERISPPGSALFALMMLATTAAGDAYTFSEYEAMFRSAGLGQSVLHELPPTLHRVVISTR